ncbi:P-loop NTPase fold protein [Lachnospiraceae bacterium 45-W7]
MRGISHKVGIKLLNDDQLYNTFPGFDDLWRKIEEFKGVSIDPMDERRYQDTLMYDNVFSVLGERGTGKTSVLYTLKEKIRKQYKKDMIFPIIMPEIIPEGCDILGWILAVISEKLELLFEEQGLKYSQKCHVGERDELRQKLERMCELSFSMKYNPKSEKSFYEVVSNSERQTQNAFAFAREMTEFWTKLAELLKSLEPNEDEKGNPMIYFFFDDVDLAPERVSDLFSVVTKYLAHPNIIVIITADENQIMEVTEINITNRMKKLPREWQDYLERNSGDSVWWVYRDEQVYMKRKSYESAKAYLLKILPTSTRYYLKEFNKISEKQNFIIENDISLDMALKGLLTMLFPPGELLSQELEQTSFYFHFVGDSSRKMSNAYFIMRQFVEGALLLAEKRKGEKGITEEKYKKNLYESVRQFITLIIRSNTEKFENVDEKTFADRFFLYQYNNWDLYVNYQSIIELYRKNMDMENEQADGYAEKKKIFLDMCIALYALGFFIERVLLLLNRDAVLSIYAESQKYDAQNGLADFINEKVFSNGKMIRSGMERGEFLEHYEEVFKELGRLYGFDRNHADQVYDYLHCFDTQKCEWNAELVKKLFYEERAWFENTLGMVSMVYENVFVFGKEMPEKSDLWKRELDLEFITRVKSDLRDTIEGFFCEHKQLKRRSDFAIYELDRNKERELLFQEVRHQIVGQDGYMLLADIYECCRNVIFGLLKRQDNFWVEVYITDMRFYCSDLIQEMLCNLLMDVREIEEVGKCMEDIRDKLESQYKQFDLITILDKEKYLDNASKIGNSARVSFDLYRNMIEDTMEEGKRIAYDNRILNFARDAKKILDRELNGQREFEERENVYSNFTAPYHKLMESVATCVREEDLHIAIDFCVDAISYVCVVEWYMACKVEWACQKGQAYSSALLSGVLKEGEQPYYAGFYEACKQVMNGNEETWVKNTFESVILEARREYAEYILN